MREVVAPSYPGDTVRVPFTLASLGTLGAGMMQMDPSREATSPDASPLEGTIRGSAVASPQKTFAFQCWR